MIRQALNILLIEDDPDDAFLFMDMLSMAENGLYKFHIEHVTRLEKGLRFLDENKIDIILTDLGLPDSQGLATLDGLISKTTKLPIVVLTGHSDEELGMQAVHRGAQDYLVKNDIRKKGLARSLIHAVERKSIQKDLLRKNAELKLLYQLSSAIDHNVGIRGLSAKVLESVLTIDIFQARSKGALFLMQGEALYLMHAIGCPDDALLQNRSFRIDDCQIGIALGPEDNIVSKNIDDGSLHALKDPAGNLLWNTILPLESNNRCIGVLCLHRDEGVEVDSNLLEFFRSLGNLIGLTMENAQLFEETQRLSLKDPLTNLFNRRFMEDSLKTGIQNVRRFEDSLSIILLDVDHFKRFNDENGHLVGDKALCNLAVVMERETRENDVVARYGGEEFVIIMPRADISSAYILAERIRVAVESELGITVSSGVSTYRPDLTEEQFLEQADKALYYAKHTGRNKVQIFDDMPQTKSY